jgi:organic hydroperoxide reductase OsmC/OhrA
MKGTEGNQGYFPKNIKQFEHVTTLDLLAGYKFNVEFDEGTFIQPSSGCLTVDEPAPFGEGSGLNPAQLLSAALGSCASVAFLYCLRRRRIEVKGLKTKVITLAARNEKGYWRINGFRVELSPEVNEEDKRENKEMHRPSRRNMRNYGKHPRGPRHKI